MNIAETASGRPNAGDRPGTLPPARLRREPGPDELETAKTPVDLADVAEVFEGNPKAVLFRAVGPERQELVGNVAGSRSRIAQRVRRRSPTRC